METGHRHQGDTTIAILLNASSIKLTPNGLHYMHRSVRLSTPISEASSCSRE